MSGSETLSKSERICSERRIDALFKGGRRGNVHPVKYCWTAVDERVTGDRAVADGTAGKSGGEVAPPVAVMFSVPKKAFRRAWKRNLIKRRLRESYRRRKHALAEAAAAAGRRIEIAFICAPATTAAADYAERAGVSKGATKTARTAKASRAVRTEAGIPDFKTIDNAIEKILEQIIARS